MENENMINNVSDKSSKKNKIIPAFIMLVVTAFSLINASYAWFIENTDKNKDGIDVNVSVDGGIQVSVDAVNWKGNISTNDILKGAYEGNTNQLPNQVIPVFTVGDVDPFTGFMKMFKGSVEADVTAANGYRIVSEQSVEKAGTNGDFVAFDLFILAPEATTIYLTTSSDVMADMDANLKNATRVAFLYQGSVTNGATSAAIALKSAADHSLNENNNIIWEPNSNTHTSEGISQANDYGETSFDKDTVVSSYYGIKAAIARESSVDYQSNSNDYFDEVTPDIQTPAGNYVNGENKTLFNLSAGINKIRIYGWVEGQDYDCEKNTTGSNITYNIQISKNALAR